MIEVDIEKEMEKLPPIMREIIEWEAFKSLPNLPKKNYFRGANTINYKDIEEMKAVKEKFMEYFGPQLKGYVY